MNSHLAVHFQTKNMIVQKYKIFRTDSIGRKMKESGAEGN
jgi:hypothetical protein